MGWASWGETFKRFLPHTPSSNAPASRDRLWLEFGHKAIETEDLARSMAEIRADVLELKENYERRAA